MFSVANAYSAPGVPNIGAFVACVASLPMVMFVALRDCAAGEEALVEYHATYWSQLDAEIAKQVAIASYRECEAAVERARKELADVLAQMGGSLSADRAQANLSAMQLKLEQSKSAVEVSLRNVNGVWVLPALFACCPQHACVRPHLQR